MVSKRYTSRHFKLKVENTKGKDNILNIKKYLYFKYFKI